MQMISPQAKHNRDWHRVTEPIVYIIRIHNNVNAAKVLEYCHQIFCNTRDTAIRNHSNRTGTGDVHMRDKIDSISKQWASS